MKELINKAEKLIDVLEEQLTYEAKMNDSIIEAIADLKKVIEEAEAKQLLKFNNR